MFDFDPRDYDSRDDERYGVDRHPRGRGCSDPCDRDDDWSQPEIRSRDRDDDARGLGRGPGDDSRGSHPDEHARDRQDDARWLERDRDPRDRDMDPRDVFTRNLRLPRGLEREIVRYTPCLRPAPLRSDRAHGQSKGLAGAILVPHPDVNLLLTGF